METVVSSTGIAKTIEAEKEAFLCTYKQNKPTQILDVMLFTEIFENVSKGTVRKKNFESISCLKDIDTAKVLKCNTKKHL
jgi:ribosome maturation protein Sdo1